MVELAVRDVLDDPDIVVGLVNLVLEEVMGMLVLKTDSLDELVIMMLAWNVELVVDDGVDVETEPGPEVLMRSWDVVWLEVELN